MGRKSTKENKTIYQRYREQNDLTREKAAELLDTVSEDRIERIENEKLLPDPEDVIRMAECYKAPDLCNFYCSHQCPIGKKYVPAVEMSELPNIILETVASLNAMFPLTNRLIEISRDGQISDDEIPDFASIQEHLWRRPSPRERSTGNFWNNTRMNRLFRDAKVVISQNCRKRNGLRQFFRCLMT